MLASADRATLLLALTSPRATRCYRHPRIRAQRRGPRRRRRLSSNARPRRRAGDLLRDDESALCAADAERLVAEIGRRCPASVERVFLSDAAGQAVILDRAELRVGARRIDLMAPLEWRASLFQERGAHMASVCQATWVNQGDVEIVLVAPLPADGAWMGDADVVVRAAEHKGAAVKLGIARDPATPSSRRRRARPSPRRATRHRSRRHAAFFARSISRHGRRAARSRPRRRSRCRRRA